MSLQVVGSSSFSFCQISLFLTCIPSSQRICDGQHGRSLAAACASRTGETFPYSVMLVQAIKEATII